MTDEEYDKLEDEFHQNMGKLVAKAFSDARNNAIEAGLDLIETCKIDDETWLVHRCGKTGVITKIKKIEDDYKVPEELIGKKL